MAFADGAAVYRAGVRAGLTPDPALWIDEWSRQHAYIPRQGNAESGKYDLSRTPYAAEVLRVLSPEHPCTRVVVMAASQMLKTQSAMNWMMATIDAAPANILALMPSEDLASRLSARINATLNATPRVAGLFSAPRSRDGKNTDSVKTFRGGTIHIATAGSAANLAEIPARYGYGDEIDDWEADLQGQGDPIEIFENRGSTYGRNRKWYYSSSPKKPRGMSKILELFEAGDQRQYEVSCPHCDERHPLVWENMRTDEAVTWARMMCPHCGALIDEHHKTRMLAGGAWVPTATSAHGTASFTISQLYAPLGWTSWLELARLHATAEAALRRGDPTKMQVFFNTRLARVYDRARSVTTAQALMGRAEDLQLRAMPEQALVATMAVDVQANRLEAQIEAWGPGMEHWVVDYVVLDGSPTVPPDDPDSVWARLDDIRLAPLRHASGIAITISACGIDSGACTQDVYNYASRRAAAGCVILKGGSRPNRPIIAARPTPQDVEWGGRRTERGAELWIVGTDVAKDWLFDRIELRSGPGAMHMPRDLGAVWFEQFLAERKVRQQRAGRVVEVWRKEQHVRNEALDVSVYNVAMAHKLGLHRWTTLDWQRLRERLISQSITQVQPAPPTQLAPARRVLSRGIA